MISCDHKLMPSAILLEIMSCELMTLKCFIFFYFFSDDLLSNSDLAHQFNTSNLIHLTHHKLIHQLIDVACHCCLA